MTASEGDSSRLHRLHGSTLIFRIGMWIRRLLVPALLAILVAQDAEWEFWLMIGFVPVVVYEIIRYFTFRYTLADDEIVMRWGLLFKNDS